MQRAHATHRIAPGPPPLAVGDSTMLLALPNLAGEGYDVDAHGCRQFDEGIDVLRSRKRGHRLPALVTMALGADASISRGQIERTLRILGRNRVLCLVTPRELGGGSGSDADNVRYEGHHHPRRVVVLDWVAYARGHGGWFQPDGLHLTLHGAKVFANYLRRALIYAAGPPRAVYRPPRRYPPPP